MKHIKSYTREVKYKYLSAEAAKKLEVFINDFLLNSNIDSKIDNLTLYDFKEANFDYDNIWDSLCSNGSYGDSTNIYSQCDKFCALEYSNPALRNTLFDITKKYYKTHKIESKLDKKLIGILEKKPEKYRKFYDIYGEQLNKKVTAACEYMIAGEKYNM